MVNIGVNPAFVSHRIVFSAKGKSKTKQECSLGCSHNRYCSFGDILDLESLLSSIAIMRASTSSWDVVVFDLTLLIFPHHAFATFLAG